MGKDKLVIYHLEELLDLVEDWEREYVVLLNNKLENHQKIDLIIRLNNFWVNPKNTLKEVLHPYFYYLDDTTKVNVCNILMRGNLEKFRLYADEVYQITISCEDQIIYHGQLTPSDQSLWQVSINSFLPKIIDLDLDNVYLKFSLTLVSKLGKMRTEHEEINLIHDSEKYIRDKFYKQVIAPLNENRTIKYRTKISENILQERKKLWTSKISWKDVDLIPFNLFGLKSVIEYDECLENFYLVPSNRVLFNRTNKFSQQYGTLVKSYLKSLEGNYPLFISPLGIANESTSMITKLKRKLMIKFFSFLQIR